MRASVSATSVPRARLDTVVRAAVVRPSSVGAVAIRMMHPLRRENAQKKIVADISAR